MKQNLYSPVHTGTDGSVTVELAETHPGFSDPAYRARRNAIASLSVDHVVGSEIPQVDYTEVEHDVWRTVSRELATKHRTYATRSSNGSRVTTDAAAAVLMGAQNTRLFETLSPTPTTKNHYGRKFSRTPPRSVVRPSLPCGNPVTPTSW